MKLSHRIAAFSALGLLIRSLSKDEVAGLARRASSKNNWFTEENVSLALENLGKQLNENKLKKWLETYSIPEENTAPKRVGVIMPGNVPLAGSHDFLSVLLCGHELHAKLNAQSPVLLPFLAHELCQIEPEFQRKIFFEERLKGMDAYIATLYDDSSRYFEQYLSKVPHIIRKNRTSCAMLDGTESREELERLGEDMTLYYGLSSRNVKKLFVPEDYNFTPLFEVLEGFSHLRDHHRFVNHYDYNKSIYLINGNPHLDTGFLLFKEDKSFFSPISVTFYERYQDLEMLKERLEEEREKIQCIVGHPPLGELDFGQSQKPEVWDFCRHEDPIEFLQNL